MSTSFWQRQCRDNVLAMRASRSISIFTSWASRTIPGFRGYIVGDGEKAAGASRIFMIPLQRRMSLMGLSKQLRPSETSTLYTPNRDVLQLSKHTGLSIAVRPLKDHCEGPCPLSDLPVAAPGTNS